MARDSSSTGKVGAHGAVDVDAYLKSVPSDKRAALQKLRKTIGAAAPQALEGFAYGVPGFRFGGRPLAGFAATAHHCSFYPMSAAVISAHAADLKDYDTSKGAIRFQPAKPLPAPLVRKLVRARLAELGEG